MRLLRIVQLVLNKPDAEPMLGINGYRSIALASVMSATCLVIRMDVDKRAERLDRIARGRCCRNWVPTDSIGQVIIPEALGMAGGQKHVQVARSTRTAFSGECGRGNMITSGLTYVGAKTLDMFH